MYRCMNIFFCIYKRHKYNNNEKNPPLYHQKHTKFWPAYITWKYMYLYGNIFMWWLWCVKYMYMEAGTRNLNDKQDLLENLNKMRKNLLRFQIMLAQRHISLKKHLEKIIIKYKSCMRIMNWVFKKSYFVESFFIYFERKSLWIFNENFVDLQINGLL